MEFLGNQLTVATKWAGISAADRVTAQTSLGLRCAEAHDSPHPLFLSEDARLFEEFEEHKARQY